MDTISLTINGKTVSGRKGMTILEAARSHDIYIPSLCSHPDLHPANTTAPSMRIYQGNQSIENHFPEKRSTGCGLCMVAVDGVDEVLYACTTHITPAMVIQTNTRRLHHKRSERLIPILERHPHACLTCAQSAGCSQTQCSTNVPENERCCPDFGRCELQAVAAYVTIDDRTPKWISQNLKPIKEDPLFERDYNLCIGCLRCVRACSDLRGAGAIGFVFDASEHIQVGTLGPDLSDSGCRFCMACATVCPTGAVREKNKPAASSHPSLAPCTAVCPAHIDVPEYLRLIAHGKTKDALKVILEKVPFPGILGRVCVHPCEDVCHRGEINTPVSICLMKRYVADAYPLSNLPLPEISKDTGKHIAIAGAGPAGLTAAFHLRKKGHAVTLFEKNEKPGGMLRYGIPRYRLPEDVLNQEIDRILKMGIHFESNTPIGPSLSVEDLKKKGFDAVFLSIGAQLSRKIPLSGNHLPDVMGGIEFLHDVAAGKKVAIKDSVLVMGGGNVAVDVAMTALRLGAVDVKLACLECFNEMPAGKKEIEAALLEGIVILPERGPKRILTNGETVTGVDFLACTSVFDEDGKFCPRFDEGEKECILVDQVILAVGQALDLSVLNRSQKIKTLDGMIDVDEKTLMTAWEGVFAGGDAVKYPGTVIDSVALGKKAAASMDRWLGGTGDVDDLYYKGNTIDPFIGKDLHFAKRCRSEPESLPKGIRVKCFDEIKRGFSQDMAVKEASRCLQCDLKFHLKQNPLPPDSLIPLTLFEISKVPETEGVFQLYDEKKEVILIKGTINLREDLSSQIDDNHTDMYFEFEKDKLFSKRESELMQRFLQRYGRMPLRGKGDDLDDLF